MQHPDTRLQIRLRPHRITGMGVSELAGANSFGDLLNQSPAELLHTTVG